MELFKLDHPRRIDEVIDYFGGQGEANLSAEELDALIDLLLSDEAPAGTRD